MHWEQKILITGVPRSGTTFTGKCISLSRDILYLWEPFNSKSRRRLTQFYPYVGPSSSPDKREWYRNFVSDTLKLRKLKSTKTLNPTDPFFIKIIKHAGINRSYLKYKRSQLQALLNPNTTILIKDPASFFLTEFLIQEFDFKTIVVIRHPAAVSLSRKKLNWRFNPDWWYQKDLYQDRIADLMRNYDMTNSDIHSESALIWMAAYDYLLELHEKYPHHIRFVTHENLCIHPHKEFEDIFTYLNLSYTQQIRKAIDKYTSGQDTITQHGDLSIVQAKNALELVDKWKRELSKDEIDHIQSLVNDSNAFNRFYV